MSEEKYGERVQRIVGKGYSDLSKLLVSSELCNKAVHSANITIAAAGLNSALMNKFYENDLGLLTALQNNSHLQAFSNEFSEVYPVAAEFAKIKYKEYERQRYDYWCLNTHISVQNMHDAYSAASQESQKRLIFRIFTSSVLFEHWLDAGNYNVADAVAKLHMLRSFNLAADDVELNEIIIKNFKDMWMSFKFANLGGDDIKHLRLQLELLARGKVTMYDNHGQPVHPSANEAGEEILAREVRSMPMALRKLALELLLVIDEGW